MSLLVRRHRNCLSSWPYYLKAVGKSYIGKTCIYCGDEGSSRGGDHVFARKLFPIEHRAHLPQVPSCDPCNRAKSHLEHYLLTLLPFGGHHAQSSKILTDSVPGRLAKNPRLHGELAQRRARALLMDKGIIRPTLVLPFEGEKLLALFRYVVRGLTAHHWQVQIPKDYAVGTSVLTQQGASFVEPFFRGTAGTRVDRSLGRGLVEYSGIQASDNPFLTIWRFRIYGGVQLSDGAEANREASGDVWGMSAQGLFPGFS